MDLVDIGSLTPSHIFQGFEGDTAFRVHLADVEGALRAKRLVLIHDDESLISEENTEDQGDDPGYLRDSMHLKRSFFMSRQDGR